VASATTYPPALQVPHRFGVSLSFRSFGGFCTHLPKSTFMKIHLLTTILLLAVSLAFAADSKPFELRAVADAATDETREYSMPQRDGRSEKVLLHSDILLEGTAIKSAAIEREANGAPGILITLTESGGKRFGEITTKYVGKRLGIILDGKLHSTPSVRDPILGGRLTITGNFTELEAAELVKKLNLSIAP
jgi:preprotein translocase subunit SecD